MYFEYHKKSTSLLKEAKDRNFFPFEGLSDESIMVRYSLILHFIKEYNEVPILEKNHKGGSIPIILGKNKKHYWSLSHSQNYIAWTTDDVPCGIDIVEYLERDESLLSNHTLEEYEILGGESWTNFYRLWSSKEAIIKKLSGNLDDMQFLRLIASNKEKLTFVFFGETHTITSISKKNIFISYTHSYDSI